MKVYPRYKVYIKKNAIDSSGKLVTALTGATYTWTVSAVDVNEVAELSEYSGTTSLQHMHKPPLHIPSNYLIVVEEACQHFTIEDVPEVPPTCTQAGWTAGRQCVACKKYMLEPEVIPARGHDFIYDVIQRTRVCKVCGVTKDEDQPVKIMQSDVSKLMNIVEELMLDDASTMLNTTPDISRAAKVFIQQYKYTDATTGNVVSPDGEFHIYFEDTQKAQHYLTVTPIGQTVDGKDATILSHGTFDVARLQKTANGRDSLPTRFVIEDGYIIALCDIGNGTQRAYYLVNAGSYNTDNNISISSNEPKGKDTGLKLYSNNSVVNTPTEKTQYVLAAEGHTESSNNGSKQLQYVTGIVVR